MRCSYRHNMWCNCKKPIHHDVHVTGIGDPSVSEVTLQVSESISITFSYSPSNAPSPSSDILLGTDGDAVEVTSLNYADGLATMIIDGRIAGNATVWYQLGEDASTRKTISVTVPQPEPFSPTNSIYVTKDTPGEAIQTKSKKSKKTLATAVGETYQARIFAVNSSSANYVLMEWIYGGDASITAWVGNTYNEYTTNLFNDQAVLNKIAREIESYDDRHLLGDNVTKFTDATWTRMENYFDTEFSPELATQVQGYIIDNGGTRFVSPYFNPEISDTVGNDGEWITVRGWLPAEGGTFYTNPQNKLLMGNFQRVSSVDHNVEIQYRLLGTGTSIAGYESASGHRAEIEITSQDSGYIWPEFVDAGDYSVPVENTYGYNFYYTPAEASIDDLSIYSGDTNVFTVSDKQGGGGAGYINITGQNEGSADLNITTLGGGVLAQPTITVTPFVHVETIGAPSVSDVTLNIGEYAYVNVPFTPANITDITQDVPLYIDNNNIATTWWVNVHEGTILIYGVSAGTTQVHYYLISDPETVYTVDVTVTAPEVHYNLYNNNEYSTEGSWNLNATNTTGYVLGDLQATEFNNGYMETYEVLNNALFGSKDFSMGTWVKLRSLPTGNDWISMLCTGEPNGNYNAVVGYSQGQVYLGGWQNDRATGYALNIGEWYHLVMTHSNGTAKLYVNGNLEYEANDVNFNIQSGHFVIGSNLTTDNQFVDGYMNEAFIANREYTAGEIATIYNNSAASHEEMVWVYFQSNDDAKGSLSLSQLQVPTGSPVVVSGNTVTIDGTTVTATPNLGNFFFGFTGAPSTISGDEYITANFFVEGETPTISYALGTVTSAVDKSISVPGYKVSQIEFSGTTNNMGTWGGIWMPVKAQDGNDWFGTYIQLGSNEGIYNSSFHNEIKKDGSMYRGLTAQNYGLGQTSTSFHSTLTKDVATYTYGEYSDTYTFSDHSGDYANWVKQLLARTDLIASVSPTNSSFENASIVVQYEPAVLVSELQNVPQSIAQTFNRTTTYNFDYLPINADIVDIEITSDNGNVQITDQRDDGNGVYSFSLYGAAEGQDSLNVYLNGSISTTIPVEVQGIHVDTLSGFLENSISLGEGGHKEVNLDITPNAVSDIGMDINLWSDDGSIAQAGFVDVSSGVVNITGISAGQTQVHASLTSDPGTVYDLDVTVEEATAEYNLYQNDGAETKGGYSPLIMQNTDYGDVAAQCTKFSGGNSAAYTQTMFDDSEPLQGDFSWVGWVRFEEGYDSETRVIFSKGDGGWVNDSNFSLVMLPSKNLQLSTGPGGMYSTQDFDEVPFTPVLKKWYHIGYTLNWSTNEINLYIDGQLVETWTPDIAPGTTGTQFMIGRYHNNRRGSFVGYMNEIMFTKKELSALEISDIYDAQASSHTNILPATISGPSENSISLEEYEGQNVTFSYTPNNVEIFSSLVISSTDDTIAKAELGPFSNGTAAINISGMGVGNATISYYLDSDPLTVYTISVTVTQSSSLYTPTQNTIAYFPFKGTVADFSGNEIPVGNNNWSEGNKGIIFSSGSAVELNSSDIKFVGMWYKASSDFLSDNSVEGILWYEKFGELSYSLSHSSPTRKDVICLWKGEGYTDAVTLGNMSYDEWHYFARGVDSNGDLLVVKDGSIYTAVENGTGYDFGSNFKALRGVLNNIEISDLIIDGATWDTQDIVNYYSATHSKYQTVMVTVTSVDDSQGSVDSNNIEAIEGDVGTISGNTITVSGTTVTATANPGFEFDHWEDGQGNVATGTFTVSVGMEFVAHFAQSNE